VEFYSCFEEDQWPKSQAVSRWLRCSRKPRWSLQPRWPPALLKRRNLLRAKGKTKQSDSNHNKNRLWVESFFASALAVGQSGDAEFSLAVLSRRGSKLSATREWRESTKPVRICAFVHRENEQGRPSRITHARGIQRRQNEITSCIQMVTGATHFAGLT
jgi:hypothetical protein